MQPSVLAHAHRDLGPNRLVCGAHLGHQYALVTVPDLIAARLSPALRRLRALPGARRLNDWTQRTFAPHFADEAGWAWVDDFDGGLRVRVHRGHHIGGTIYWHGAHSFNELALLRQRMSPGLVFVDGGAHLGHFSLVAAARGATVLAVEPVKMVRDQLITNLGANGMHNVIVSDCALHEHETTIPLFSDPRNPDDPVATSYAAYGRVAPLGQVRAAPLDTLVVEHEIDRVDLIKLDLEGNELFALRGAQQLIERWHPELIVELSEPLFEAAGYSRNDLLDFLESHGYRFGVISDYRLRETIRRPARGRYGKVRTCVRGQLPMHGNIYAATPATFDQVSSL